MHRVAVGVIALALGLSIVISACQSTPTPSEKPASGGSSQAAPAKGGKLVLGLTQEPDTLDPHTTALAVANRVFAQIYDPLIWKTTDGKFHPGLAKSWDTSPDGLVYTFNLREGVKFHDGTPFNAEAVKINFDRVVNPDTKAKGALSNIGPYAKSEVVSDHVVKVTLKEPFAPFLDSVSQPNLSIISPAAIKQYGADLGQHPVGAGAFKFVEWISKDHILLTRNKDYNWAPDFFKRSGPAHLESVEFKFILENAARMATLETGETNAIESVTAQDLPRLEGNSKIDLLRAPWGGMVLNVMLNAKKFPTNDVQVRKAMLYAHDPDTIVNTLFKGIHTPARGPLPPTQWGYDKSVESLWKFDLAKAKQILDEAGWKPGPNGIRVKDGQQLKVLMINQPGTKMEGASEMIQAQQREAGILVEISDRDRAAGYAAYSVGEHNLAPIFLSSSEPHVLSTAFLSKNIGAGFNRTHHASTELDKYLNDGATETNPDKRLEHYAKAQQYVMSNALTLPIYNQIAVFAVRSGVDGMIFDPRAYPLLYDVSVSE